MYQEGFTRRWLLRLNPRPSVKEPSSPSREGPWLARGSVAQNRAPKRAIALAQAKNLLAPRANLRFLCHLKGAASTKGFL
jgi:hypothetical protein